MTLENICSFSHARWLDFPEVFNLLIAMSKEFSEKEFSLKLVSDDYLIRDGVDLFQLN